MLERWFERGEQAGCFLDTFRLFPEYGNRKAWNSIDPDYRDYCIRSGEEALGCSFPALTADRFFRYFSEGVRDDGIYFERREILFRLLVAECLEGKKRFLPKIADAVWLICEESTWMIPAHLNQGHQRGNVWKLPKAEPDFIDLFCAETGSLLAWVFYFLRNEIAALAPEIGERVLYEIRRQIVLPFRTYKSMWWMGNRGEAMNNWNPWILSNLLTVFLVLGEENREEYIRETMRLIDHFIRQYPADGGCEEGSGYWNSAAGMLFDYLEQIYRVTNGELTVFEEPLLRNMGEFIFKMYISHNQYVNFADASPKRVVSTDLIYRFGERTGSDAMCRFAAMEFEPPDYMAFGANSFFRQLNKLWGFGVLKNRKNREAFEPADQYLEDLQVFTARSRDGRIFAAGKGGHNDESHNHNDVGQVILYCAGRPVILDPGTETYTSKTFGPDRYDIWTMRSEYHNLPTINGYDQKPGRDYSADKAEFRSDEKEAVFSVDIKAYPEEAGVRSYRRKLVLEKETGCALLTDDLEMKQDTKDIRFRFMLLNEPGLPNQADSDETEEQSQGVVLIHAGEGEGGDVRLEYDSGLLEPEVGPVALGDEKMRREWGTDCLYRLTFRWKQNGRGQSFRFRFVPVCDDNSGEKESMKNVVNSANVAFILAKLDELYGTTKEGFFHKENWQLLAAIMLSAQSTDKQVDEALPGLFREFPTAQKVSEAPAESIEDAIRSVGLYKVKAKNLKECCTRLVRDYGGEVPDTIEGLLTLPGVGRKTATLYLADAYGIPGVTVDTHVFRISRRLGWASGKNPAEVEKELRKVLPEDHWNRINFQLIYHGRSICTARKAKCEECPLAAWCERRIEKAGDKNETKA